MVVITVDEEVTGVFYVPTVLLTVGSVTLWDSGTIVVFYVVEVVRGTIVVYLVYEVEGTKIVVVYVVAGCSYTTF